MDQNKEKSISCKPSLNRLCTILLAFVFGFIIILYLIGISIRGESIKINLADIPNSTNFSNLWTDVKTGENLRDGVYVHSGESLVMSTTLPVYINEDEALCFLNNNFHVKVVIGGSPAYELGNDHSLQFGRETGTVWSIIDLGKVHSGQPIQLTFTNSGKDRMLYLRSFIGPKSVLTTYLITSNVALVVACVALMILGILLIAYFYLLRSRRVDFDYRLFLHLGLLTILSSLWLFSDSYLLQYFTGNPTARYLGSYFSFIMLPIFLILFFRELSVRFRRTFSWLLVFYLTDVILILSLYVLNVVHISLSIVSVHLFIIIILVFTFIALWVEFKKDRRQELRGPLLAFVLLCAAAIAGLYMYYHSDAIANYDNSRMFSFGIVVFILVLLFTTVRQSVVKLSDIILAQRYKELAYIDNVTGGSTMQKFRDDVASLDLSKGGEAILLFNLRHFKLVNESLGRELADNELRMFHHALSDSLNPGELLCRDAAEFILLVKAGNEDVLLARYDEITASVHASLNQRARLMGYSACAYLVTGSDDLNRMVDRARMAHDNPKAAHYDDERFWVYNDECRDQLLMEKRMEDEAVLALDNGEFIPYLQPKISPTTGKLIGAEALVRWQRPDGTLIPPGAFIPLFERNGFIFKLDLFMFLSVCRLINAWCAQGVTPPLISVNLSKAAINRTDLFAQYESIFRSENPPPQYLELEFTESMAYEDPGRMQDIIRRIHSFGVQCSIDDFGSGYSNFNDLMRFDFDTVKLDKCFFDFGFPDDDKSRKLVSGVIAMLKRLGMTIIAEGLEEEKQVRAIAKLGCDAVQGFFYSRPLPTEAFFAKYYSDESVGENNL